MKYLDALRFLQRRDDWERTGSSDDASRWDLRRMHSLLARLGDPHLERGTVHVAGSKGKGSTSTMIDAGLRAAGCSTGLHTKPHLHRFVERIVIDGEPVSADDFGRLMGELAPHIEAEDSAGAYGAVSTFEALVALTFLAFRERGVAWQVLEVGLGGRLDATNVFETKEVSVITPIGLEHTAILGDTVVLIAEEKAAIITPGSTVIMAPQRESAADVIRRVAAERAATLIEVAQACALRRTGGSADGQDFVLRTPNATYRLRLPLLGAHQLSNAATAVLALEALAAHGVAIDEAVLRKGLEKVKLPGRIEVLRRRPLVVADGAHNRDSARALVRALHEDFARSDALFVVGCSSDKDIASIAEELAPAATHVIAARSRHPRAVESREVARAFAGHGVPVTAENSVGAALDSALAQAGANDAIVACGSLFVAAEAREHVLGVAYDPPLASASSGARQRESEVNA
ncbi:MAG: folylpolyglutamate synthase/dihydrofolate synthase family protein [Dehalococcoidia bacterium]